MDERIRPAYELLKSKIENLRREIEEKTTKLNTTMSLVDELLVEAGEEPEFGEEPAITIRTAVYKDPEKSNRTNDIQVKPGEFYGKPLLKVVRTILDRKGEALPFNRIIELLKAGGYDKIKNEADEKWARTNFLKSPKLALLPGNMFMLKPKNILRKERRERAEGLKDDGSEKTQIEKE